MDDSRLKIIAAGATTLTSAAFQISTIVGNEWIRGHVSPQWVIPLWVMAAALWGWWAITRKKGGSGAPSAKNGSDNTNQSFSGRDTFAPQINSARDVYLSGGRPTESRETKPTKPLPQIRFLRFQQRMLLESNSAFTADSGGTLGLVLCVENPEVREDRSTAIKAYHVAAVVRFSSPSAQFGKIQRAFWLNHIENEVNIAPGQHEAIVIGQFDGGMWKYFNNKRKDPMPLRPTSNQLRNILPSLSCPLDCEYFFLNPSADVEVNVITGDGEFLGSKSFRITTNSKNDNFSFEEIE
jgi:hypothetical protein